MPILIIIALLIILILVSLSSSADSYATAQMAQAQIETARAAQISAGGNVLAMMILGGLIVLAVLLAAVLWIRARARERQELVQPASQRAVRTPTEAAGLVDPNQINALIALMLLDRLQAGRPELAPPVEKDQAADEPLSWLK